MRHILDARYEKMRHGGIVRDAAVLSAIGIGPDERRRVLGVSVTLSEAEVHWRAFLESLVARRLRGVEFIVSDDHSCLRAARRAVLGGATWQRCQFHLARNAIHHAPNAEIRKRIGRQLKSVWNADDLAKAETALAELVTRYRDTPSFRPGASALRSPSLIKSPTSPAYRSCIFYLPLRACRSG